MTPSCEWVRARLARFLDGELPPGEAGRVEEHVAVCAGCLAALEALRRADRLARDAGEARETAQYESVLAAMRRRYDLEAAARLRERDAAAGPLTPEQIAAAPLERELLRRPAARAHFWRWLAIGVPAAAAAVFAIVLLVREPEMRRVAREPATAMVKGAASRPAPETKTVPAPAGQTLAAKKEVEAAPEPAARQTQVKTVERPATSVPEAAAPPVPEPAVAAGSAPTPAPQEQTAQDHAVAEPPAPAAPVAAPLPDPWPSVVALAVGESPDEARRDASAREMPPVSLLLQAEDRLTPRVRTPERAPSRAGKPEKGGPSLQTGFAAAKPEAENRAASPASAEIIATPADWLAIGDAWYALMQPAAAAGAPAYTGGPLPPDCGGLDARVCFARKALAAYRQTLQEQTRARGGPTSLAPDAPARVRARIEELRAIAGE
jgi:hypothetical protein